MLCASCSENHHHTEYYNVYKEMLAAFQGGPDGFIAFMTHSKPLCEQRVYDLILDSCESGCILKIEAALFDLLAMYEGHRSIINGHLIEDHGLVKHALKRIYDSCLVYGTIDKLPPVSLVKIPETPHVPPPSPILVGVELNPGPDTPPAPRLVGVELNPGPGSRRIKKAEKYPIKKAVKTLRKAEKKIKREVNAVINNPHPGPAPRLFAPIGRAVGTFFGGYHGGKVGEGVGDWFSRLTGMGDYQLHTNSLINGGQAPRFGESDFVVKHAECLGDISGSTAFTITKYTINPGNPTTFPWLSTIANQFEQYKMLGLVFFYKENSANALNSTNTALGTTIMATDYDAYDAPFSNKIQMEAYKGAVSTPPSCSALHGVECKRRDNIATNLYTSASDISNSGDNRLYDVGNFYIATVGMQAAAVIGELWVGYHVAFERPKLETPLGQSLNVLKLASRNVAITATNPSQTLLTNVVADSGSTIPFVVLASSSNLQLTGTGRYFAAMNVVTSGGTIGQSADWTPVSGVSRVNYFTTATGTSPSVSFQEYGSGTTNHSYEFVFDITPGTSGVLTLPILTCSGATTATMELTITQIPGGLTHEIKLTPEQLLEQKIQKLVEEAKNKEYLDVSLGGNQRIVLMQA